VKPLRIYIAGPYSADSLADREANVDAAIGAAIELFRLGHFPYVPHLTHFVDLRAHALGANLDWDDYLRWDEAWLEVCDALVYLSPSPGADRELEFARSLGKTVYLSVNQIAPADGASISPPDRS
jgi:hypothetical protein